MHFPTLAAAAAFLPALVSGHVLMNYPESVYTHSDGTDLNPLNPDGSNYPCFYTDGGSGTFPTLALGSSSRIGLQGSAVHGGGSCQISVTYDVPPNKNSQFKVLKSYQGNCPIQAEGNLPADPTHPLPGLQYELPSNIPSGKAVIAWTWFNKIGNREMYMRCAPVTLTGGSKDSSGLDSLPDMFKANIGNGCSTTEGVDLTFPNPGTDVVGSGNGGPVGNCGGSSSPPPPKVQPPVDSPVPTPPTQTKPEPTTPIQGPIDTPTDEEPEEVPSSPPTVTEEPVTEPSESPDFPTKHHEHYADPSQSPSPSDTPVEAPVETPVETPVYGPDDTPDDAPVDTPDETPSETPSEVPTDGPCIDGKTYCVSSTTWAICNYGTLVPMGNVAGGTQCQNGYMVVKRNIRFSDAHARRRALSLSLF